MKLTHLRDITSVAERGSLRAAARQLGIAQPAITRSIREVERELGVALFERQPRGVVLTPMGQLFLRRAVVVQNELRLASEEIAQMRGMATGQVSLALSSAAQISLFPRVLGPFRKRFPEVLIHVTEGLFPIVEAALQDGTTDLYVGPLPELPPTTEFAIEKLFDNTRLIFGRRGHPMAHARSLAELTDARWIRTMVAIDKTAELTPVFESHGLPPPKVEMQVSSAMAVIMAAANSDLLAMLPVQWLEAPLTRQLLEPLHIRETLPAPPICIVYRSRSPLTPAAEFLSDLFRRASQQHIRERDLGSATTGRSDKALALADVDPASHSAF